MDKELFCKRVQTARTDAGFLSQEDFATEYDSRFQPEDVPDGKKPKSIYGTVKKYERAKIPPRTLQIISNMCDVLNCDADYLLGRIDKKTHDVSFISEYTGLSESAIGFLRYIHLYGDDEAKNTISFINRVLSDQSKTPGSALTETTLFSWLEQYVTLSSVRVYDLDPDGRKEVKMPSFEMSSGLVERIDPPELYKQFLLNLIRDTLEGYRIAESVKSFKKSNQKA